ncbi:MAG: rRNA maturation RNase YbeY [Minisyncoccia bacterium]
MKTEINNFGLINHLKGKLESLPFAQYKNSILGTKYNLVINFVSKSAIQKLNKTYRNINKPTDILSFPLDKKTGEIFICQEYANKKAGLFKRKKKNYLAFLVIHGLVHLKGFEHCSKMERVEEKYRKLFGI